MANIFRKKSIDRLSSPEQLDTLITVTSSRTWMTLICIGIVLACVVLWSVFGRIPIKVDTSGILISSGGNMVVEATADGQVTDVRVETGDSVKKGDVLVILGADELVDKINENEKLIGEIKSGSSGGNATVKDLNDENDKLRRTIESNYNVVAPYDGKIVDTSVLKGEFIKQGDGVVTIAKTGSDVKTLEAVFYVPVSEGRKIQEGMEAKIYPTTVQKEEFGYMKATVSEVPEYPVSKSEVFKTLGNEALVQELTGKGAPLEIHAELVTNDNTVSGYAWSTKKGGKVDIQNGTFCQASVVISEERPIGLVIPIFKQKALPIIE